MILLREVSAAAEKANVVMVDAPVSGGVGKAQFDFQIIIDHSLSHHKYAVCVHSQVVPRQELLRLWWADHKWFWGSLFIVGNSQILFLGDVTCVILKYVFRLCKITDSLYVMND